jgi:dTDP-4-dehydrorhamnose 3,5-epimerase
MIFKPAPLPGVFVIEPEPHQDSRGMFARTFCSSEMEEHGLKTRFVQCNISFNYLKGTLRGLHWQEAPASECKLIRCTSGALYDVIIDMRPWSPTYLQHFGIELNAANRRMLYIPDLFAHGYQALADNTEAAYQVTEFYTPQTERGVRYDDPAFGIQWPLPVAEISEKDRSWPLFESTLRLEQTA